MRIHTLEREQVVPLDPGEAFAFFGNAANLEPMTPPWLRFRVLTPQPFEMRAGTRIDYRLVLHGIPIRWTARITDWEPGVSFADEQLSGPYKLWQHAHTFHAVPGGTLIRDVVRYALPLGPLGALAHVAFVRRDLERIFDFRRDAATRLMRTSAAAG